MSDAPDRPENESAEALAARWEREHFDNFEKQARGKPNGKPNGPDRVEPLTTVRVSSWHGLDRPVRKWLDGRNLFRVGYVSILTGPGAVGKTLVALQASIASVAGLPWLAAPIKQGPVIFYSAEEPLEEMHIRCDEITEAENIHLDRLHDFHIIDLNNEINAALITQSDEKGKVVALTELFHRLDMTIGFLRPICVWLDNRSLLVTGNENDRNLAAFSMRHLQLLAEKHQCAIILLAHPSNAGVNDGTGASGSTAWFNMARSVVYMTKPKPEQDEESVDKNARVLTNNKPNYSEPDKMVHLKWEFYRFICTDPPIRVDDDIGSPERAKRVFLTLLGWHNKHGSHVSLSKSARMTYAPRLFRNNHSKEERENVSAAEFAIAMKSLLDDGKIANLPYGPKSDQTRELRVVDATCDLPPEPS